MWNAQICSKRIWKKTEWTFTWKAVIELTYSKHGERHTLPTTHNSAVNPCFLCADRIHSDICRIPLDSLLCLTVTSGTRSLWTATHTHTHAVMSMIWSVLSAVVQLHKGNSCWNITGSPLVSPSIYHTNTVASSAYRERTQQRHLQDGLRHTTPPMCSPLWCGGCWVNGRPAAELCSSSGFIPLLLFLFCVNWHARRNSCL